MRTALTTFFATGALLAFAFTGAVATTSTVASTEAATKEVAAKKVRIGVSIPSATHGWTAGINWWAKRAVKLYPDVEFEIIAAEGPEKQIADIETLMTKGIDGLVILATESAPLTPIAKEAKNKGIFIVNVDRGFTEPGIADIFLEGDNKAFGRKSAEFIVQRLKGKGNVVVLRGIPSTVDSDRVDAGMEVFKANPGIKVLDVQPAFWNRQKGLEVMEAMLAKHSKIDAVWAQDDDIALGALQAIQEKNRESEMWIFPGAGMKEVVKKVMDKDPMFPANITYSPSMIAAGIHMAASVLRDGNKDGIMEFMPRHLKIDVELITPDNAKRFYFPDAVY
jgi:ribose transport system substrate-binding protein